MKQRLEIPAWTASGLQIQLLWDFSQISWKNLLLDEDTIIKAYRVMALDIADILSQEVPGIEMYIRECLSEDEILGLLEALALYNLVEQGTYDRAKTKIDINNEDSNYYWKLVDPTIFTELFEQSIYFSTNWKLHPPELRTLWNLESARQQWAQKVIELLSMIP